MGRHALLSASSSHRWLACPPSARLCENYEDTGSEYAQQGTDAHSLCEHKLKLSLGMETADPTEGLEFYDDEMEECACGYAEYVLSLVEEAKKTCRDPVVLIEQRLDFSRYVEEGFGTGDCVIIADGTLYIIDYKHGKGVEVSAEGNPQMMLYALGALELFDGIYDIDTVRMAIYQPRRENVSVYAMAKDDLLQWAEGELSEKAKLAYAGEGEFCAGEHCKFCKAKAVCRKRAEYNLELAKYDFEMPATLEDDEIAAILVKADELAAWAADVKEFALQQALSGVKYAGFKIVEGRSNRKYTDEDAVADTVKKAGFDPYEPKLLGITAMEKLLGKKKFAQILKGLVEKPQGKIDLIVTKSVSRFARNTVDSLTTVRKLKEKGVEVYFQKENIYTLDSKGELLITIMSSLAQEESRSISENVTWGKRKRFADGKVSLAYSSFLGYRKGEDGQMEVVPEEAETVRLIYRLFMQGQTPYAIAKYLTDRNIPTPTGKETWRHRTVENILSNEKYKGDARLQKCYTVDFLSKKRKANEGEVPQYYVEGSHDAIIEPTEWQLVQMEIQRRKNTGRSHNCCSPFSAKLRCGDCGEYFGSKVWHSNSKYKRTIWQCNAKFKGESKCATPHLYEQRIKELFLEAAGILMENRETVIGDCRAVMEALADCSAIDAELEAVSSEMEVTAGLIQKLVDENATRKLDQHDYRKKYDGYASRYAALESRMDSLEKERERKESQYDIFSGFLAGLSETEELPVDFNEKLFHRLVDYATVYPDGRVVFTFRNGVEVGTEI